MRQSKRSFKIIILMTILAASQGAAELYDPYLDNVDTYIKSADYSEALKWVDRAVEIAPLSSDVLLAKARVLELAHLPNAEMLLRSALNAGSFKRSTKLSAIQMLLGVLNRKGFFEQSRELLMSNIGISEIIENPNLVISLFDALIGLGEENQASSLLDHAIKSNKQNYILLNKKLMFYGFNSLDLSFAIDRVDLNSPSSFDFLLHYLSFLPPGEEKTKLCTRLLKTHQNNPLLLEIDLENQWDLVSDRQELVKNYISKNKSSFDLSILKRLRNFIPEQFSLINDSALSNLAELYSDDNSDMWKDRIYGFKNGKVTEALFDQDHDGIFELVYSFENDIPQAYSLYLPKEQLFIKKNYENNYPHSRATQIAGENFTYQFWHSYRKNEERYVDLPSEPISLLNIDELKPKFTIQENLESILEESESLDIYALDSAISFKQPFTSKIEIPINTSQIFTPFPTQSRKSGLVLTAQYNLKNRLLVSGSILRNIFSDFPLFVQYKNGALSDGLIHSKGDIEWIIFTYANSKMTTINVIGASFTYSQLIYKNLTIWDLNKDGKIDIKELNSQYKVLEQSFSSKGNGDFDINLRINQ